MKFRLATLCALLFCACNTPAALDMFLKLDQIPGESIVKGHANEIDVLAFSWGVSNPATISSAGGGLSSGKPSFQELSLTKYVDLASPQLMTAAATGKHIASATFTVMKNTSTGGLGNYYTVTLTEVLVTSLSTGGSGGEDRMTENITLNYAKIKIDYYQQKPDGSITLAGTFTYDVAANTAP